MLNLFSIIIIEIIVIEKYSLYNIQKYHIILIFSYFINTT